MPNAVKLVSNWGSKHSKRRHIHLSSPAMSRVAELKMVTTMMMPPPGYVLSANCSRHWCKHWHVLTPLILTTTQRESYHCYPHFINKKPKIQRGKLQMITEPARRARIQTQAVWLASTVLTRKLDYLPCSIGYTAKIVISCLGRQSLGSQKHQWAPFNATESKVT